jgi:hypothetical protein
VSHQLALPSSVIILSLSAIGGCASATRGIRVARAGHSRAFIVSSRSFSLLGEAVPSGDTTIVPPDQLGRRVTEARRLSEAKIGTLSPVLGFWVHLNARVSVRVLSGSFDGLVAGCAPIERLGSKKGMFMLRNHRNAVLAACTAVAEGVAVVQLPKACF